MLSSGYITVRGREVLVPRQTKGVIIGRLSGAMNRYKKRERNGMRHVLESPRPSMLV